MSQTVPKLHDEVAFGEPETRGEIVDRARVRGEHQVRVRYFDTVNNRHAHTWVPEVLVAVLQPADVTV